MIPRPYFSAINRRLRNKANGGVDILFVLH